MQNVFSNANYETHGFRNVNKLPALQRPPNTAILRYSGILTPESQVTPFLYAASWLMTSFATQLPFHIAARIIDFVFLQGIDAIYKVTIVTPVTIVTIVTIF